MTDFAIRFDRVSKRYRLHRGWHFASLSMVPWEKTFRAEAMGRNVPRGTAPHREPMGRYFSAPWCDINDFSPEEPSVSDVSSLRSSSPLAEMKRAEQEL